MRSPMAAREKPTVTVIVPTFNREKFLPEAIDSLLRQTVAPDQILIVDDGSTDGTGTVASSFPPPVEYYRKDNGGKSTALNFALKHCTGDFVWIFDDDDVAHPTALERFLAAFEREPEADFAFGEYARFQQSAEIEEQNYEIVAFGHVSQDNFFPSHLEYCHVHQPGLLVRRECYEKVGGFNETLVRSQDYEMMLRLARRFKGIRVDGLMFFQRQHDMVRGSTKVVISYANRIKAWGSYDRAIMEEIYKSVDLHEYLDRSEQALPKTADLEMQALLQRSSIMARKGLWHHAAEDIRRYAQLAERAGKTSLSDKERAIVRRTFEAYDTGLSSAPADEFVSAVKAWKSGPLKADIVREYMHSFPHYLARDLKAGKVIPASKLLREYSTLSLSASVSRLCQAMTSKLPLARSAS
ncbi:MAG: glycosyltransferase family 2 protein [Mesorhizobium sp.]|nr:MAG: glycosyltransferase family 2 protein [Mesorhizobium sp.]